ncbi:MAG TPA: hypothetical protein VJJ23_03550 [Candidatus Nanoarchaeia archaeon]|nr:hypothetical protein [Candidatus Nanoarchaeia archaeon]
METEVIITYDTLYEILRREKTRQELQDLNKTFFKDVTKYIEEKSSILNSQEQKSDSVFAKIEIEKTKKQIENIKKLVKELYEKRESKIIQLAIIFSRTNPDKSPESMLPEELELYNNLINLLNDYRQGILHNLIEGKLPLIQNSKPKDLKTTPEPGNITLLRITSPIPKFIGDDLEIYGPFDEQDIASLPQRVADVLIKNNRAEIIQQK